MTIFSRSEYGLLSAKLDTAIRIMNEQAEQIKSLREDVATLNKRIDEKTIALEPPPPEKPFQPVARVPMSWPRRRAQLEQQDHRVAEELNRIAKGFAEGESHAS